MRWLLAQSCAWIMDQNNWRVVTLASTSWAVLSGTPVDRTEFAYGFLFWISLPTGQ